MHMVFVSRLIIVVAILGVLWIFWPFGKLDDEVLIEPPRGDTATGQLFTKPLSSHTPQHARTGGADVAREQGAQDIAAATPEADTHEVLTSTQLQPKRFYRVRVQDGSSIRAGDTTITLAEIEVDGLKDQCEDSRGETWPCGRAARSALMRLIRGRAVMCHVPASGAANNLAARCSVGGKDLSFWMVAQGWAKPKQSAQAAFKEAEAAARERRLGIWR